MKKINYLLALLLSICYMTQIEAAPKPIHPVSEVTIPALEKNQENTNLFDKKYKKCLGWSAKLKGRLITSILKRKIQKQVAKQAKIKQVLAAKSNVDSISVEQLINLSKKDLAKRIGVKNNVRTRAKLNMMRHKYKEIRKNKSDIIYNKIAVTDLEKTILSGDILAAEVARYFSIGSAIFFVLGILSIFFLPNASSFFLTLAFSCLFFQSITFFRAMFRDQKGLGLESKRAVKWLLILLAVVSLIFIDRYVFDFE